MRKYIIGFAAGIVTYHFAVGGFNNQELISELRGTLQKIDDRLAETEKEQDSAKKSEAPTTEGDFS